MCTLIITLERLPFQILKLNSKTLTGFLKRIWIRKKIEETQQ